MKFKSRDEQATFTTGIKSTPDTLSGSSGLKHNEFSAIISSRATNQLLKSPEVKFGAK